MTARDPHSVAHDLELEKMALVMQCRQLREERDALDRARSHYADLFELAPIGYVSLDLDGRILEINLTGAALLGNFRERLVGRPFPSVLSAPDRDAARRHLASCAEKKEPVILEIQLPSKSHGALQIELTTVPLRDVRGGVTGFSTAMADVSARKETEDKLRFLADAGRALAGSLDPRVTLEALGRLVVPAFADLCLADVADAAGAIHRHIFSSREDGAPSGLEGLAVDRLDGLPPQGAAGASEDSILLSDLTAQTAGAFGADNRFLATLRLAGMRSLIRVPLPAGARVLGALTFGAERRGRFAPADLLVATMVARRVGAAMENARLYDEAQRALGEERAVRAEAEALRAETACFYTLTDAVGRADSPDVACEAGLDALATLLHIDRVGMLLLDGAPVMRFRAWRGLSVELRRAIEDHPPRPAGGKDVAPILIEDTDVLHAWEGYRPFLRREGIGTLAFIPMTLGGRIRGEIVLCDDSPGRIGTLELQHVQAVARHVGQAVARCFAEEALRRSQRQSEEARALLDTLLSKAPVGLGYWGRDLSFVRVNESLASMSGVPVREHLGRQIPEVWTGELGCNVTASLIQVLETGEPLLEQELSVKPSAAFGSDPRSWLASYYPVPDARGAILGIGTVAIEITERKKAEAQLRLLSDASSALSSSLDAVAILDHLATTCLGELATCCVLALGAPNEPQRWVTSDGEKADVAERLGRFPVDWQRLRAEEDARRIGGCILVPEVSSRFLDALARNDPHRALLAELDPRSLMYVPVVGPRGTLGGIAFLSSAPGRRYGGRELCIAQELASRAALALENARLYQEAQKAIADREKILGIVSHDLRNPLHAILVTAQLLSSPGPHLADSEKHTRILRRSAARMDRMIRDLLDFSSIEEGRLKIDRAPCMVGVLVAEAMDAQQPIAEKRAIHLSSSVDDEDVRVSCDHERIQQVFANLIGNAVKFTGDGGAISLRAEVEGAEVWFSVTDSGAGMAAEQLEHVFDRFWQASAKDRRGTGLGLSIAKGIVESHGGRIWVTSTPHVGSTFTFTLPRASSLSKQPSSRRQLVAAPTLAVHDGARTVLVVEDDEDVRHAIVVTLRAEGYQVADASNGAEALTYLRANAAPSLVLLDLDMPVMDGWEFLAERNRDTSLKAIPVIVTSGARDVASRLSAENAELLSKPVHPERLLAAMSGVVH